MANWGVVIGGVMALAAAEYVAALSWRAWYFRNGPVVFRRRLKRTASAVELASAVEGRRVGLWARVTAWPLGPADVGFYTYGNDRNRPSPVLRGHITVEPGEIIVCGRIVWSVLASVAAILAALVAERPSHDIVALVMVSAAVVGGILLMIDLARFARLISELTR